MDKEKIKFKLAFWYSLFWFFLIAALYIGYVIYFQDTTSTKSKWVILFASSLLILLGSCKFLEISFYSDKNTLIKNEVIKRNKINNILCLYKNIPLYLLFIITTILFKNYINIQLALCGFIGLLASSVASKIASYTRIKGLSTLDCSETSVFKNTISRIKFNTYISMSSVYIGIIGVPIAILFHIFKDYEVLVGYACAVSLHAFFENSISIIMKNAIEKANETLSKFNIDNPLKITRNAIFNSNISSFGEIFIISLICSVIIGANYLGLMGMFLPLIIASNIIFTSTIFTPFLKINKSEKLLKSTVIIGFIIAIANISLSYFEIIRWLGKDFMPMAHSAAIGTIFSIIYLCVSSKNKQTESIQKIKSNSVNTVISLSIILTIFCSIFKITQGMEYVLFALYSLSVAILSFNSIILPACIIDLDGTYKHKSNNIKNLMSMFLILSCTISYTHFSGIEEADILNPLILICFFIGATIPAIACFVATKNILKRSKNILLFAKKQCRSNECNILSSIHKNCFICSFKISILLVLLCIALFYIIKKPGYESLLALIIGANISCSSALFDDDKIRNSISGLTIRLCNTLLLASIVFFI